MSSRRSRKVRKSSGNAQRPVVHSSSGGNSGKEVLRLEKLEVRQEYSGPLPHPNLFKEYEEVLPGVGQTIVDEFVRQGAHRRDIEAAMVSGHLAYEKIGLILGFIVVVAALVVSGVAFYVGYQGPALATFFTTVVGVLAATYFGRISGNQKSEDERPISSRSRK